MALSNDVVAAIVSSVRKDLGLPVSFFTLGGKDAAYPFLERKSPGGFSCFQPPLKSNVRCRRPYRFLAQVEKANDPTVD